MSDSKFASETKPPRARGSRLLVTALLLCLTAFGPGQESAQDASLVHEKVERLVQLREDLRLARQRHRDRTERAQRDLDRLNTELQRSRDQLSEERRQFEAEAEALAARRARQQVLVSALSELSQSSGPIRDAVRQRIQQGIPYRREARLPASTNNSPSSPEQAQQLQALVATLTEELRLARTRELRHTPVQRNEAHRLHVREARWGILWQAWESEDRSQVGVATGDDWSVDLPIDESQAIRTAIQVLAGEQQPRWIPLPVPTPSPLSGGSPR